MKKTPRKWLERSRLALAALIAVPVIAIGAPDTVRIPMQKAREKGDPPDSALFSHWEHSEYGCFACHPSVFPQKRVGFTHDDMAAGRFCGSCHDGVTAFGPKDKGVDCETCHVLSEPPEEDDDIFDRYSGH